MGTRAVFTFSDTNYIARVYQHWDGYPSGAYDSIKAALTKAWPLPRFEADEFAAAFVAANKTSDGGFRIIGSTSKRSRVFLKPYEFASDIDYSYYIEPGPDLYIRAFRVESKGKEAQLFSGTLSEMKAWIENREKEE